ncbi:MULTISPECIES: DNA-processing protein DprA [unclassified Nonomuraea]|uniref:DNA-processing protein DprA n=1 Tax=unclassified Nonomuraea TaxID=2593643 RepID=UPI00137847E4|nr:DNA-processing protein DprA [Nonomuraea sp. KC401]NBE97632.1 DNA-processing protein DprA [Nonomuraea sp. K271]
MGGSDHSVGVGYRDDRERAATVALLRRIPTEKGERELVQHLTEGASAEALLRDRLAPVDLFSDPLEEAMTRANEEIASWERSGIHVITLGYDRYPYRLRDVFDRPPLLFARGTVLEEDDGVAVVGSRSVSSQGRSVAAELAVRLVERELTVVSGLAAGVDTAAHRSALGAGGRTVAVIGTGIHRYFPAENRDLHREVADRGAVFSQFWPDRAPDKSTFPPRNGTMSGYSLATIIVEASERSGTRIQARKAVEHGRPVILMRSVVDRTEWGKATASKPDVHVARDVDEAMVIVDDLLRRPKQLEDLLSRIG